MKSSQVYFTNMQNESRHRWETGKTLRSTKSAAPSINNLKRFTLSGISQEIKIIKRRTETHVQQKLSYINTELRKRMYKRKRTASLTAL